MSSSHTIMVGKIGIMLVVAVATVGLSLSRFLLLLRSISSSSR